MHLSVIFISFLIICIQLNDAQFPQFNLDTDELVANIDKVREDLKKGIAAKDGVQFLELHTCTVVAFEDIMRNKNNTNLFTFPKRVERLFGTFTTAQKIIMENFIENITNNITALEDSNIYTESTDLCTKLTKEEYGIE